MFRKKQGPKNQVEIPKTREEYRKEFEQEMNGFYALMMRDLKEKNESLQKKIDQFEDYKYKECLKILCDLLHKR